MQENEVKLTEIFESTIIFRKMHKRSVAFAKYRTFDITHMWRRRKITYVLNETLIVFLNLFLHILFNIILDNKIMF